MNTSQKEPHIVTILVAAMGGEGGGVLADWLISAANRTRLPGAEHLGARRRAAHWCDELLH